MAGVDNGAILLKSNYQFKGPLTENFFLQQLKSQFDVAPRYYSTRYGEIDFLLQSDQQIIPVEVKGGEDKSAPTFKKYIAEKAPDTAVRFSEMGYMKTGAITNLPLYLASAARRVL
mgnify:CR=1 FL=1